MQDITFSEDNNTVALETLLGLNKKGAARKKKPKTSAEDKAHAKRQQVLRNRYVRPGCGGLCKISCIEKINQERRVVLNEHFWRMDWTLQKSFLLSHCGKSDVKRRTTKGISSQRTMTLKYKLPDVNGVNHQVCKIFFLTILGYNKKNDGVVFRVFNTTSHQSIIPSIDRRGRHPSTKKFDRQQIVSHIESFHQSASHYRREQAPNVRYLPSDVTTAFMHQDFLQ
nr:unnamed protein product [Callosobruchus analis]